MGTDSLLMDSHVRGIVDFTPAKKRNSCYFFGLKEEVLDIYMKKEELLISISSRSSL